MREQIPTGPPHQLYVVEQRELHESEDCTPRLIEAGPWVIPAVMWRDIVEVRRAALEQCFVCRFKYLEVDNIARLGTVLSPWQEVVFLISAVVMKYVAHG